MGVKKNLNHKCIICGELYEACDTCERITSYTPWRTIVDTFEHYQIYLAIRSYQEKFTTKEECIEELSKLGVKAGMYANWPEGTRNILDEIFKEDLKPVFKKPVKEKKEIANKVDEPLVITQE